MTSIQRPTITFPCCTTGQAHDWRVSSWVDFEIPEESCEHVPNERIPAVHGRSAAAFYCANCLAQVDASVLYAERSDEAEEVAPPAGQIGEKQAIAILHDIINEAAQVEVGEFGSLAAEMAEQKRAALELAISKLKTPAV